MGALEACKKGIFNPTIAKNGQSHLFIRGDRENYQGRILHFLLGKDVLTIEDYLGIAIAPSSDPNAKDSISCEDPRAFLCCDPYTKRELLYITYAGWNGKFRPEFYENPVDTRNMLAVAYGPNFEHFHKLGPIFKDSLPDKDAAIIDIKSDGTTLMARRPMVGEKWVTYIMKAPNIRGPYQLIDIIPTIYDWNSLRNGISQFVHIPGVGYLGMLHGVKRKDGLIEYSFGGVLLNEQGYLIAMVKEPDVRPLFSDEVQGIEGKRIANCTGLTIIENDQESILRMYSGRGDWNIGATDVNLKDYLQYLLSPENRIPAQVRIPQEPARRIHVSVDYAA